jgi:hypothetical protein
MANADDIAKGLRKAYSQITDDKLTALSKSLNIKFDSKNTDITKTDFRPKSLGNDPSQILKSLFQIKKQASQNRIQPLLNDLENVINSISRGNLRDPTVVTFKQRYDTFSLLQLQLSNLKNQIITLLKKLKDIPTPSNEVTRNELEDMKTEFNNILREVNYFLKDSSLLYEAITNNTMTNDWVNQRLHAVKLAFDAGLANFAPVPADTYVSKYDQIQTNLYTLINQDFRSDKTAQIPNYKFKDAADEWAFIDVVGTIPFTTNFSVTGGANQIGIIQYRDIFYFRNYSRIPFDLHNNPEFLLPNAVKGDYYYDFYTEMNSHPHSIPNSIKKYTTTRNFGNILDADFYGAKAQYAYDAGLPAGVVANNINCYKIKTELTRKLLGRFYALYLYLIIIESIFGNTFSNYQKSKKNNIIMELNEITDHLVNYGGNTKFNEELSKPLLKTLVRQYKKIRSDINSFIICYINDHDLNASYEFLHNTTPFTTECFNSNTLTELITKYVITGINNCNLHNTVIDSVNVTGLLDTFKRNSYLIEQRIMTDNVVTTNYFSNNAVITGVYTAFVAPNDKYATMTGSSNLTNFERIVDAGLAGKGNDKNDIFYSSFIARCQQFMNSILQLQSGLVMLGMLVKDQKLMIPKIKHIINPTYNDKFNSTLFEAFGRMRPEVMCTSKFVSLMHDIFYLNNRARENITIRNAIFVRDNDYESGLETAINDTIVAVGAIAGAGGAADLLAAQNALARFQYTINNVNYFPRRIIANPHYIPPDIVERMFAIPVNGVAPPLPVGLGAAIPNPIPAGIDIINKFMYGCQSANKFIQKTPVHNPMEYRYLRTVFYGYTPEDEPKLTTNLYQIPRPIS